jgi:hypothetical protein
MCNADDKMLVENPNHRYKVGSDTKKWVINEDGALSVKVQQKEPKGTDKTNWVPAPRGLLFTAANAPNQ